MTVEIALIPDGQGTLPQELVDDGLVAHYLRDVSVPEQDPIDSWKAIERDTAGDARSMTLRVRGVMLSDVPDTLLAKCHETLTKQVSGVKPHPSGWQEYDESEQQP